MKKRLMKLMKLMVKHIHSFNQKELLMKNLV